MSYTIKPRWWHWLLGVVLPSLTIGFELCTHEMSGTLFDPIRTPWHALLMAAVPVGIALAILSHGVGLAGRIAVFLVGIGLPYNLLLAFAIGPSHLTALLKLVISLMFLCTQPVDWMGTLFGDYCISPISGVAYFGPVAACLIGGVVWFHFLITRRFVGALGTSLAISFMLGAVIVVCLEARAKNMESAIVQALAEVRGKHDVTHRELLLSAEAKDTIARLSRPGQQFSSDGELYAVGPVDIFGPWTFLRHGRPHPVTWLVETKWPDYSKLHEALWPGQAPAPKSWRGLSTWEEYRVSHQDLLQRM
jgi:hypothetical protein